MPSLSTVGAGAVAGGAAAKEREREMEAARERETGGGGSHRDPLEEEPRGFCRPARARARSAARWSGGAQKNRWGLALVAHKRE